MEEGVDKATLEGKLIALERLISFLLWAHPQQAARLEKAIDSHALTFYQFGEPAGESPHDEVVRGELSKMFRRLLSDSKKWEKLENSGLLGPNKEDKI